jgi:hypothetical protein
MAIDGAREQAFANAEPDAAEFGGVFSPSFVTWQS